MALIEESIIITDEKYKRGIALDEYKKEISLVSMEEGKNGGNYTRWGFPQGKDRQPIDKCIPWKISLGQKQQAIQWLEIMLDVLKGKDDDIAF